MARAQDARFGFLTSGLSSGDWALLSAIASEWAFDEKGLQQIADQFPRVFPRPPGNDTIRAWVSGRLQSWRSNGLVVDAGVVSLSGSRRLATPAPAFAIARDLRQLVLRRAHAGGALTAVTRATRDFLGERSFAHVPHALLEGDIGAFERGSQATRWAPPGGPTLPEATELLQEAISLPFDAQWFERTFGELAVGVAETVLDHALHQLLPSDELYEWCLNNPRAIERSPELAQTLSVHAVMRGDATRVEELSKVLATAERWSLASANALILGDLDAAQRSFDESASWANASTQKKRRGVSLLGEVTPPSAPLVAATIKALAPLTALLALNRDPDDSQGQLKRWLKGSKTSESFPSGVARALRTLLKHLTEFQDALPRLDVHQLPPETGVWELFILGMTAQLHVDVEYSRAAWARRLTQQGMATVEAGYLWFGRQTLHLAKALSAELFEQEYQGSEAYERIGKLEARPGEIVLHQLVQTQPEWAKTLKILETVSDELEEGVSVGALRASWYLDMTHGKLSKPGLERYGKTGWGEGKRVPLAHLHGRQEELPAEDAKVLGTTTSGESEQREFTAESFEALIGHPRVYDGSRGKRLVEVARAECHIDAELEQGALVIRIAPENAELGVNVVVDSPQRLLVYRITAATKKLIDLLPQGLKIPQHHQPQALRVLGKLSQTVDVRSKELGQEQLVASNTSPCLRIAPAAGAWMVQIGVRPFGESGRFFPPGTGRATLTHFADGRRLRTERNIALELSRAEQLVQACEVLREDTAAQEAEAGTDPEEFGTTDPINQWVLGEERLLSLLSELKSSKLACEIEWPQSRGIRVRKSEGAGKNLNARLRRKKGWYLLEGSIKIDDITEVALADLVQQPAVFGGRFVRLPNGDYLELEKRIQRVMSALSQAQTTGKKSLKLPHSALTALDQLAGDEGVETDDATEAWLQLREEVTSKQFEVPTQLKADLRSYQIQGFLWMCRLTELGFGACLADDMGLGKTIQIIALMLLRQNDGPTLVVAPTSVCANWIAELIRFAPTLQAEEYSGPHRSELLVVDQSGSSDDPALLVKKQVLVVSYGLLQQDIDTLERVDWGLVVLDEAQFIKNPHSLRAKAARKLEARHRIAATGTPIENHLGDLWSIFQFLNPGLLSGWQTFNHLYLKPIERDQDESVRQRLRGIVAPFILRRTKGEVLKELPKLTEVRHDVHLSEDESKRYALLRRQIHEKLRTTEGKRNNKLEILAELMRLRRFCCHARLVFPEADFEGSKVATFLELAKELKANGHRTLVFSQFVDFLGIVREQLEEQGLSYQYLDGSTPRAQRAAAVEAFQAGVGDLFLISLKAGGFGLNLTAADYVIHLDPWWNPAVEAQATDRAHRIGQERPVTVYRLVTKDTIEESIIALHREKRAVANALLSDSGKTAKLSAAELIELIDG